jgi:ATP-binding cassette subfamily F protein 3
MRILAGKETTDSGERFLGHNVSVSYFAQDQAEELDLTKDVLTTVEEIASNETRTQIRTLLGSFLFHGDDVFKRVSVLSGGEKSRLALARMLLQPTNFLIMDEPTNHLDMKSKQVLQEALTQYAGTFIIVSHDRAFLDPLVNKVLELKSGSLKTFLGNVHEYLVKKQGEQETEAMTSNTGTQETVKDVRSMWQIEQERRKIIAKDIRSILQQIEQVETKISQLEKRKTELELLLADPDLYKRGNEIKSISVEFKGIPLEIEECYSRWSKLTEKLEKSKNEL